MKKAAILAFLALCLYSFAAGACDTTYNSCITNCCSECGSTLDYNSNGDLVCNAGTQSDIDQQCVNMCMPCATNYQDCVSSGGNTPSSQDNLGNALSQTPCCGPSVIFVGVLAAGLYFRRN